MGLLTRLRRGYGSVHRTGIIANPGLDFSGVFRYSEKPQINAMKKTYDVLIIGGGIIGLSTACSLRKRGLNVLVLDKGEAAQEASRQAAGMLHPHAGPVEENPLFELLRASYRLYPDFIAELEENTGVDTDFKKHGFYGLVLSDENDAHWQMKKEWQDRDQVVCEWVSGEELRRREPQISPAVRKALYFPEDGQVDNIQIMDALLLFAARLGVDILPRRAVLEILLQAGKVQGVKTAQENIFCGKVINCAGAWSDFDRKLPFRVPVKPSRGQIMVFRQPGKLFHAVMETQSAYLVTRSDGRIVVGSTIESAGFHKALTVKGINKLLRGVAEACADADGLILETAWSGLRPKTPDTLPVLDLTPIEGLYAATGHYRNGILLAPVTARIMTALVMNENPPLDLRPFRLERFAGLDPRSYAKEVPVGNGAGI